jgi:hypothetical protein
MREWDPLGVGSEPDAQDEYDSYIPAIMSLLVQDKGPVDVAALLGEIARKHMGMPVPDAVNLKVAALLTQLDLDAFL